MGDRVYVKVDVSEEKTSSGLLLPVSAQKKPTQGEIVGAGTAKAVKVSSECTYVRFLLLTVKWICDDSNKFMQNGDKVVYSKYAGTELKVEGADYVLLKVRSPPHIQPARAASCLATICCRSYQSLCTNTP